MPDRTGLSGSEVLRRGEEPGVALGQADDRNSLNSVPFGLLAGLFPLGNFRALANPAFRGLPVSLFGAFLRRLLTRVGR